MALVLRIPLLAASVTALVGCEVVTGIHDKTLAADPSLPCAQQQPGYLFCDDFDTEAEAGGGWLWDTPKGGATIELDANDFKTPPRSVKVVAPIASLQAQLGLPLASPIEQSVRLAFDLRVDMSASDFAAAPEVAVAQLLSSGNNTSINYLLGPEGACRIYVYDSAGGGWSVTQAVSPPPPGRWTRIVMAYDAAQGVTLLEDGATLYAADPSTARGAPGGTDVILGAVYVNPPGTKPLQIELDDVVVRGQ
jgi:hypothetical protein